MSEGGLIDFAVVWGQEKTRKTSLALSFPKPIAFFDFDLGAKRAMWRHTGEEIQVFGYPQPKEILLPDDQVHGMSELFHKFIDELDSVLDDPKVKTVVVDTATILWTVCHRGYLQEVQVKNPKRENLTEIEYATPNARMKAIIDACRGAGKILVFVHWEGDVYKRTAGPTGKSESYATGEKQPAGFSGWVSKIADILVRTLETKTEKGPVYELEITKCGLVGGLTGMKIVNPTYDKLVEMIKGVREIG